MKVSDAISQALVAEGVTLAAGISGQSIGHVLDSIAESPSFSLIYVRQERVAFDICDGFARASGKPAVVFTDAGPAAANLMGGLVNSWGDSIPVLFLAGHNDHGSIASRQTKEIPFLDMFRPVSKWAAILETPDQVAPLMRRAFMHLTSGRPGPVVIGVPYDLSSQSVENFSYEPVSARSRVRSGADPAAIEAAIELLANAERPYVYTGAGILMSEATDELVKLAEMMTLPVATTINGKSGFPENHRLSVGIGGFARASYSSLPATKLAESADVILTIGCGFKKHTTRVRPARSTKHIQVDVDVAELNRDGLADVAICGDAKIVLRQLIAAASARQGSKAVGQSEARSQTIAALKSQWDEISAPLLNSDAKPINPFRVTQTLMRVTDPSHTIVLHDAGTVRGSTTQHYVSTRPRGFLGFGVESAMGWTIGAAMGAKRAAPQDLVVAFVGDEAFCETALDIETSVRSDTPILIIVMNNRGFADTDGGKSERLAHARFHRGISGSALANALGAKGFLVEEPDDIEPRLREAIQIVENGLTALVEIRTARVVTSLHSLWAK
ncbi:MAG TPA: thiamine pyrophosphate-binding protein [Beijerinckiaceae bacterium]|nr:thiamine pyrophosphate-binding protein [Beijerinckiaceae bacterium]